VLPFLPTDSRSAGLRINRLGEDGDADSAPRIRIGMPPPTPARFTFSSIRPLRFLYTPTLHRMAVIFLGPRISPGHEKKNYEKSLFLLLFVPSSIAPTVTISFRQLVYQDDVTYFFQFQNICRKLTETMIPFLYVATTVTISVILVFYQDNVTYVLQFQNLFYYMQTFLFIVSSN
jgi:hypothetical protein